MPKKQLFLLILLILIVSYSVNAICSQSGVEENSPYSNGETVTVTVACGASDKNDLGYYLWLNGSNVLIENDTFTIPSNSPFDVFPQLTINSSLSPQENLTGSLYVNGVFISNSTFNTTSTGGVNDLDIVNVEVTTEIFEGKTAGIKGLIKNQGKLVGYADVCIDVLDENDEPLHHVGCKKSEVDGEFFFSTKCDGSTWCNAGTSYIVDVDAGCPKNSSSYVSCVNEDGDMIDFATGKVSSSFIITSVANKFIIKKWQDEGEVNEPGIFVRNEFDSKVEMKKNPTHIIQQEIDWSGFNNTNTSFNRTQNGQGFLTAGMLFSIGIVINNTFPDELNFNVFDCTLDDDTLDQEIRPLIAETGERYKEGEVVGFLSAKDVTDEGLVTKFTPQLRLPEDFSGGNDFDVQCKVQVKGYDEIFTIESDEFNIFGEREGNDYVDWITLNNYTIIQTNASEGEFVQLKLDITMNHPNHATPTEIRYVMLSDFSLSDGTERPIDTISPDKEKVKSIDLGFSNLANLPANINNLIVFSQRFKIPNNIFDLDITKIIAFSLRLRFGDDLQFEFTPSRTQFPSISIIGKAFQIDNISTSLNGTQGNACDRITYTINYTNLVSNASSSKLERLILHSCVEDTTNDLYLETQCTNILIEPEGGTSYGSFTTTIPYIPQLSSIEAEVDMWVYEYDVDATGGDCPNCGELVDFFTGDEGAFNISPTLTDACRFKNTGIDGEDKALEVQFIQGEALRGINSSSGNYEKYLTCEKSTSSSANCVYTVTRESGGDRETYFRMKIVGYDETLIKWSKRMNEGEQQIFSRSMPIPNGVTGIQTAEVRTCYDNLGIQCDSDVTLAPFEIPKGNKGTTPEDIDLEVTDEPKLGDLFKTITDYLTNLRIGDKIAAGVIGSLVMIIGIFCVFVIIKRNNEDEKKKE